MEVRLLTGVYKNGDGNEHTERRDDGNWYNNKQIYEMFQTMKASFTDMEKQMIQYRGDIKKYNGLREDNEKQWQEMKRLGNLIQMNENAPCKKLDSWDKLYATLESMSKDLNEIKREQFAQTTLKDFIIRWGGWIVGVVGTLYAIGWI